MPKGKTRNTQAREASERADKLVRDGVKPSKEKVEEQKDQTDLFKYHRWHRGH